LTMPTIWERVAMMASGRWTLAHRSRLAERGRGERPLCRG
jgi:hypothetical protein